MMTLCTEPGLDASENNDYRSQWFHTIPLPSKLAIMAILPLLMLCGCDSGNGPSEAMEDSSASSETPVVAMDTSWTNNMVWIPGGSYMRGSESGQGDEKPVREICVFAGI